MLAPMVDLSHVAFRELVRELGGCDLLYSEMLNSRIVPVEVLERSTYLKWARSDDLIMQLVGSDPERMGRAARRLTEFTPWGLDINMGCWLQKVTRHGWGVALMQEINLAEAVLAAVRAVYDGRLSVKIRIGYEPDQAYLNEFIEMLCEGGADMLVLHARTVADGLNKPPRWDYIARAKDVCRVPLIGNGGIKSPADARRMLEQTGCDGIMIGRQALIEPWIFRDTRALLNGDEILPKPSLEAVLVSLFELIDEHFSDDVAIKRMRKILPWLAQNLAFGHHLNKEVARSGDMRQAKQKLQAIFAAGIN